MKIHWYQAPILAIAALASWAANLFKSKPEPTSSASRWSDTVMAEAMDSTIGDHK